MLCLAEFIFSLLEWIVLFILGFNVQQSTVHTANQSCGQTLPTILVFVIYCSTFLLFPSSPLEPNCLEYRNSFPAFLTSVDASSASEWIDIWAGSLARQRCCTLTKNLKSFASLANIFQLRSCPLDSASTNSENDANHGLGAQAGRFRRNCTISVLPFTLARSSGVWPQLASNWKQLCLSLNHSPNWTSWISNGKKHIYVSVFRQHLLDQARINLGNNISNGKKNTFTFQSFVNICSTKLE